VPSLKYRLARANRTAVFGITVLLVLIALLAPGLYGAVPLLAIASAVFAVSVMTWRVQRPATRAARMLVLAILVLIAIYKLMHSAR
jgi:hypothetical protein